MPPVARIVVLAGCLALAATPAAQTGRSGLIAAADLHYRGAFRLPAGESDRVSFDYGGTALAYHPGRGDLMLVGHDWHQRVAGVSIPAPSLSNDLAALPTATLTAPFLDLLAGKGYDKVGGLLPWNDRIVATSFIYYDANGSQGTSHFAIAPGGAVTGPVRVGTTPAGFVSGYMATIPPEWRSALGGPALTGQCCLSIISRTSLGPALSVFDPANIGVVSPVPARPVLGYPLDHPALGDCGDSGTKFNCTVMMGGVVFPIGTRSVLFFGRLGTGPTCYGEPTSDESLRGRPVPGEPGVIYCHDPAGNGKGYHGFPYASHVWAYDVQDLILVRNGRRRPWDVRPYASWTFDLAFQVPSRRIKGAAYDASTGRVFLAADSAEPTGRPLIHVFQINPPAMEAR